jgi:hypothetical protein
MAQLTHRETPAPARAAVTGLVVALAASALLGLLCGLIWHTVAPRPVLQQISAGTAGVVNPETRAFIAADGWFCLISAVAGLLTGIIGYRAGIARRHVATRTAVTIGLILGAVAGGYTMMWLGQEIGFAAYQNQLASAATGTTYTEPLVLGAKSALAFWPLLTSVVILLAEVGGGHSAPARDDAQPPGGGHVPGYAQPPGGSPARGGPPAPGGPQPPSQPGGPASPYA